ncbi:MAG: hypothetical protein EOP36_01370 [Rubrivivax sp.]|nr:MAG: hypothetical protein EOP36_01370 [Rubrivivax sp.]
MIQRLASVFKDEQPEPSAEVRNARALMAAIDRGGLPLNPARVNLIARQLGLEVSSRAPMDETIGRIRQALERA